MWLQLKRLNIGHLECDVPKVTPSPIARVSISPGYQSINQSINQSIFYSGPSRLVNRWILTRLTIGDQEFKDTQGQATVKTFHRYVYRQVGRMSRHTICSDGARNFQSKDYSQGDLGMEVTQWGPGAKPWYSPSSWSSLQTLVTYFYCRKQPKLENFERFTSWFLTNMFHGGGGLSDMFGELSATPCFVPPLTTCLLTLVLLASQPHKSGTHYPLTFENLCHCLLSYVTPMHYFQFQTAYLTP